MDLVPDQIQDPGSGSAMRPTSLHAHLHPFSFQKKIREKERGRSWNEKLPKQTICPPLHYITNVNNESPVDASSLTVINTCPGSIKSIYCKFKRDFQKDQSIWTSLR
eukprot:TRINITY_DN22912_c0_g1_i2.p1 TRINITY_DN22912_c0_g1~~TRINITY_DN22912_c0_g1_i2.p1  ORF type:complete len:107 (+),score=7.86 TRINITY_DN22912_c0_g1_i2:859-1179(+)